MQLSQTDKPMVPFICDELQQIYIKLLKMIVSRSKFDEAAGLKWLLSIEFNKDTLLKSQSRKFPASLLPVLNAAKPNDLQRKNLVKNFGLIIQIHWIIAGLEMFPVLLLIIFRKEKESYREDW